MKNIKNMKKAFFVIFLVCLTVLFSIALFACVFSPRPPQNNFDSRLEFNPINNGTEYEVTARGNDLYGVLVIPAHHNGTPVTRIANNAFFNHQRITRVYLPPTITHIGNWAFRNTTALTRINIPYTVTHIGDWVFRNASALPHIVIPIATTHMGAWAFREAYSLTIYTAHPHRPDTWAANFNVSDRPIVWGYAGADDDYTPYPPYIPRPIPRVFRLQILNGTILNIDGYTREGSSPQYIFVEEGARIVIEAYDGVYDNYDRWLGYFDGWFELLIEDDLLKGNMRTFEFYMPDRGLDLVARFHGTSIIIVPNIFDLTIIGGTAADALHMIGDVYNDGDMRLAIYTGLFSAGSLIAISPTLDIPTFNPIPTPINETPQFVFDAWYIWCDDYDDWSLFSRAYILNFTINANTRLLSRWTTPSIHPNGIKKMAAGSTHNLVLDYDGNLWAFGLNNVNQLGIGDEIWDHQLQFFEHGISVSVVLVNTNGRMNNNRIVYIATYRHNSFAIDEYGGLWGWGHLMAVGDGVFGGGNRRNPVLINTSGRINNNRVISVVTKNFMTIAIDEHGNVWVWGGIVSGIWT